MQSPVWEKYRASVRQFDAVLEHAKAVSSALSGLTTPTVNASYGEQIFVSMLAHCVTLRRIAPDPERRIPNELWDLSSMCAVARCVVEAHDAFIYIASSSVPLDEHEFRIWLWELHDKTRRLKMLEALGSTRPEVQALREACAQLMAQATAHQTFQKMRRDLQRKVSQGDPPAFHLSQRERCTAAGLNFDYYNVVTMQLSQYVHTHPFALHQLFSSQAGSDEALSLMALPLEYVLPFLGRVTTEMRSLMPATTPDAPSRTARVMATWDGVYIHGVKGAMR